MLQSHGNENDVVLSQNKHGGQQNKVEDLNMIASNYRHLNLSKDAPKRIGEKTASSINDAGKTGCLYSKE